MDLVSNRLADLILQLHGLRDQLRAAVLQTFRDAAGRTAAEAVDRLGNRQHRSRWIPGDDRWHPGDDGEPDPDGEERSWSNRRSTPAVDPTKRNGALGKAFRAGLGWWLLRGHSLAVMLVVGSVGLAISLILGPERIAPARILELVVPALEVLATD